MLLPNGDCVWKDLSTFFVDIRKLMQYIRSYDFDGYIYCKFKQEKAAIFLEEGDSVCGVIESNGQQKRGMEIVKLVLDQISKENNTYLDIYSLPNRSVKIITELFLEQTTIFQTNLSADLFDIESYINNHLNKTDFSGFVEIKFQNGEEAIVSLKNGTLNSIVTSSLQTRKDKAKKNELKVFDIYALKLFKRARSEGSKYTIYKF